MNAKGERAAAHQGEPPSINEIARARTISAFAGELEMRESRGDDVEPNPLNLGIGAGPGEGRSGLLPA